MTKENLDQYSERQFFDKLYTEAKSGEGYERWKSDMDSCMDYTDEMLNSLRGVQQMQTIYGLFTYHYDYYEWEELEVVSTNLNKIEKYLGKINLAYHHPVVTTDVDHENLAEKEIYHYMIKPCSRI